MSVLKLYLALEQVNIEMGFRYLGWELGITIYERKEKETEQTGRRNGRMVQICQRLHQPLRGVLEQVQYSVLSLSRVFIPHFAQSPVACELCRE
jgi:hypothetical protein